MTNKELIVKAFLPRPKAQVIPKAEKQEELKPIRNIDTNLELAAQTTYTPQQIAATQNEQSPMANSMQMGSWGKPQGSK